MTKVGAKRRAVSVRLAVTTTPSSAVGYKSQERKVVLKRGKTLEENFELEEDMVALDGVVVTADVYKRQVSGCRRD